MRAEEETGAGSFSLLSCLNINHENRERKDKMSQSVNQTADVLRVTFVEIDEEGKVTKRFPRIDAEGQLKNTVLHKRYPEILVAVVSVPTLQLDAYEESRVREALMRQRIDGVEYRLVGASGSAKDGKFYAVDVEHERPIAERFQKWPQAAITYFGILVSDCRVVIEEQDTRVLVVQDHALGTNDCRGWISERLFGKLGLPDHRFYQFRLAFDRTQAKGSFKVMQDDVADILDADIILPESSIKPRLELGLLAECQKLFAGICSGIQGTRFR